MTRSALPGPCIYLHVSTCESVVLRKSVIAFGRLGSRIRNCRRFCQKQKNGLHNNFEEKNSRSVLVAKCPGKQLLCFPVNLAVHCSPSAARDTAVAAWG